MKHVKTYEENNLPEVGEFCYYWEVPIKDKEKFRIALLKIGIKKEDIDGWFDWFGNLDPVDDEETDTVFIYKVIDRDEYIQREYYDGDVYYRKHTDNDRFMGHVDVEDWEVSANKYNI